MAYIYDEETGEFRTTGETHVPSSGTSSNGRSSSGSTNRRPNTRPNNNSDNEGCLESLFGSIFELIDDAASLFVKVLGCGFKILLALIVISLLLSLCS